MGAWVNDLMAEQAVAKTRDLSLYVQLSELFGGRNTQAERDDPAAVLSDGGRWRRTRTAHLDGPEVLLRTRRRRRLGCEHHGKLFDFLVDTTWDCAMGYREPRSIESRSESSEEAPGIEGEWPR